MRIIDTDNMPAAGLAKLFGIKRQSFEDWESAGCPRNDNGKYNLSNVVQWKLAHEVGKAEASAVGPDGKFTEHQLRKQKADADAAEFRYLVMKKKYYPVDLIDKWFFGLASGVKSKLLNIPNVIAPDLYGRDIPEIADHLRESIENVIRELHEESKPETDESDNNEDS